MENQFTKLLEERRSIYSLGKSVTLSEDEIVGLVAKAVKESPSSFNSQTSRAVVLFGAAHNKVWDITEEVLLKAVPEGQDFTPTKQKIESFRAAFGTILFFEDTSIVKALQKQFALYADNFPVWSEHSSAIAQFAVWTALAEHNIGASLQHYNPIVDAEVAEKFDIPANWKLRAQLVLGSIEAPAGDKTFIDDALRFKTFN